MGVLNDDNDVFIFKPSWIQNWVFQRIDILLFTNYIIKMLTRFKDFI